MKLPSERQWVTIGLFGLTILMLCMAMWNPKLWEIDTFKTLAQAVVITGLLNMVLAFHFAANRKDEQAVENTGKAFDAIKAAAQSTPAEADDSALQSGDTVQIRKEGE